MIKKLILIALLTITASLAFCQDKISYSPVPYRTVKETIGEKYIILPRSRSSKNVTFMLKKADKGEALSREAENRTLTLISIDKNYAHFKDSVGVEYISWDIDGLYPDVTPLSDLENAKKLFINKKLWLNTETLITGDPLNAETWKQIKYQRYKPVIITDIKPSLLNDTPFDFFVQLADGRIGIISTTVSGTNSKLDPKNFFENNFFTKDPQLIYHFTPAVWQMVKTSSVKIGIPREAFELIMGRPDRINTTTTAKGASQQLIYGTEHPSYYYFEHNKLVAKQE